MISLATHSSVPLIERNAYKESLSSLLLDINSSSKEGVFFDKKISTLMHCPFSINGGYVIPSSVTTIGIEAFARCKKLTSVVIPTSVRRIKHLAFDHCSGLTSITIPASVISINYRAFSHCNNLKSIFIQGKIPMDLSSEIEVFHGIDISACILYVPVGTKKAYRSADQWKDFAKIIEV